MNWMDGHCDVLWRMWERGKKAPSFYEEDSYDVTYPRLHRSGVKCQWFALFLPPSVPAGQRFKEALKQIDYFYTYVIGTENKMVPLTSMSDIDQLNEGQCGAILHLEGAEALEGDLTNLRTLYRLGVRQVGLTWNYANEVADGIKEERNGGLTLFGREVIAEMKRLQMVVDVSHLSVRAFWEVMEIPDLAVVASHSNCRAICHHSRNLSNEQIRALIAKGGLIGLNFIPFFVNDRDEQAKADDLYRHIDHICALGGSDHLFFGSDFDGDDQKLKDLEHMGKLPTWQKKLMALYSKKEVEKWGWANGKRFYQRSFG